MNASSNDTFPKSSFPERYESSNDDDDDENNSSNRRSR